jgi:hypothetical protein
MMGTPLPRHLKWKRQVVAIHDNRGDAYADLVMHCGHVHAFRRRRDRRDYPRTLNCQQCHDEAQLAREQEDERQRLEALAILDALGKGGQK